MEFTIEHFGWYQLNCYGSFYIRESKKNQKKNLKKNSKTETGIIHHTTVLAVFGFSDWFIYSEVTLVFTSASFLVHKNVNSVA